MSYYPACHRQVWRYKHANFERASELLCDIEIEDVIDPFNIHTRQLVMFQNDLLGYHGAMYSPGHASMQEKLALVEQRNHPVDQEEESIF